MTKRKYSKAPKGKITIGGNIPQQGQQRPNVIVLTQPKRFGIDIADFTAINDTFGHATGDRVIQAVAGAMVEITREQDVVGRLGGEEFLLILTQTDGQGALASAERLRESIQNMDSVKSDDNQTVRFTISVGVTTYCRGDTTFAGMLGRADKALYAAKNAGRNQVVAVWPESRVENVA